MAKFCSNCGKEIKENDKFCEKCGEKVGASTTKKTETKTETKKEEVVTPAAGAAPVKQPKSKLAAGLLGIFLGCLGIHNFYLGYNGKAVAQLLLTVLSCGFLWIVSAIWGLIEGILILTGSINVDAEGNYLGE